MRDGVVGARIVRGGGMTVEERLKQFVWWVRYKHLSSCRRPHSPQAVKVINERKLREAEADRIPERMWLVGEGKIGTQYRFLPKELR